MNDAIDANSVPLRARNELAKRTWPRLSRRCLRVSVPLLAALVPHVANAQPAAPRDLVAIAGDEEAVLTWRNPGNSSVWRYEFRFGTGEAPEFNAWMGVPGSGADTVEYTVSGLANGTRYVFHLRAFDNDGPGEAASASTLLAASPSSTVEVPDAGLRERIEQTLGLASGAPITQGDLARLRTLRAVQMGITDIAGLEFAVNLTRLWMDRNELVDVSLLSGLTALDRLWLTDNRQLDVSSLASMTSLTRIGLSGNGLVDVSALAGMTSLRRLGLSGNKMVDLSPLVGLTALRRLELSGNELADVSALSGLTSLTHLLLSGNAIEDVSPLSNLTSLRVLYLDANRISDISSLVGMERMSSLMLAGNEIADFSPLLETGLSGTDDFVDLRDNPPSEGLVDIVRALRELGVVVMFDDGGHRVSLFPSVAGLSAMGFVRIINHSDEAGSVDIEATDETGERRGPVSMAIGPRQALHFTASDLKDGNPTKGLQGMGEAIGSWRLDVRSELDIEVLGYARTSDGFVTNLHDLVPEAYGASVVSTFNPGSNQSQVSRLRLTNPTAWERSASVLAVDDTGARGFGNLPMLARGTLDLTAAQLESGEDVVDFGGIGTGTGKWRLRVSAPGQRAMSLLQSPTGHLTNISTGTAPLESRVAAYYSRVYGGTYRVPLFLGTSNGQGFLRLVNPLSESVAITLRAFDDSGIAREPVVVTLGGNGVLHLNSDDLESGNAAKGLPGIGAGTGDWHLEVSGEWRFEVLAYARMADGFVTSLHDIAPRAEDGSLWIPFFNPGSNREQASRLRLVNWGETAAEATITGIDDAGDSSGDAVLVSLPARSARDYMAWELETGDAPGLSGALGDGDGKWRLRVSAADDVEAMSLLSLPTGHITNLSTTPRHPPG